MNNKPTIIVDTREQTPLPFMPGTVAIRRKVAKGDYAISGVSLAKFVVERKSREDLFGSIWGHTILKDGTKRRNIDRLREEFAAIRSAGGTVRFWVSAPMEECAAYADWRQAKNADNGLRGNVDWAHTYGRIRSLEADFGFDTRYFSGPYVMANALVALAGSVADHAERTKELPF